MASGETTLYDFPYPLASDPVNVHEDLQSLAEAIEAVLPSLGLPYHTLEVTNVTGSLITKGTPVYVSGYNNTSGKPQISKSKASTSSAVPVTESIFPVVGLVAANIDNNTDGVVITNGVFNGVNTSTFSIGDKLYVNVGGGLTATQPEVGGGVIGLVVKSNASGIIIVGAIKGNGTWGALKEGLA